LDWALTRHAEFLDSFVPQTFIGNHDVTRIASRLDNPEHVALALVLLMTTGGVPTIYAGDEFGFRGVKEERAGGDDAVRPEFGAPPLPVDEAGRQMFALHQYLIGLRRRHPWLHTARTGAVALDNRQYLYRSAGGNGEQLFVALNIADEPMRIRAADAGVAALRVIAGAGAPPAADCTETALAPNGWLILAPAG
jgi:glycosidase